MQKVESSSLFSRFFEGPAHRGAFVVLREGFSTGPVLMATAWPWTGRLIDSVMAPAVCLRDNPNARLPGSIYAIGPTNSARFLTVVLQPEAADPTRWHVMTGWDSDSRQIADYQSKR
jgi:hypothetical protein